MTEDMAFFAPLKRKIRGFLSRFRGILLYLIVGAITTVLNGAIYWLCFRCGTANVPATVIAWITAFLFAFFANKLFVFDSHDLTISVLLREMGQFFGCRLATGFLDVAIMYVSVDCWHWNGLLMKLFSDFVVTLINFAASKFYIFSGKRRKEKSRKKTEKIDRSVSPG